MDKYGWHRRQLSYGGFTLIELAIVMVIIGLVVGGVLVGRDLIASSQMRAQITQFEQFNRAAATFKEKYGCIPGDCSTATTLFPDLVAQFNGWGNPNGNNNGLLNDEAGAVDNPFGASGEPMMFWVHLFKAGLLDCCASSVTSGIIGKDFPPAKLGSGAINAITIKSVNGYFWGITQSGCMGSCSYWQISNPSKGVITPAEAKMFDSKIDDGQATTGNVYAAWLYGGDLKVYPYTYHSAAYNCTTSAPLNPYNTSFGNTACSLFVKMSY